MVVDDDDQQILVTSTDRVSSSSPPQKKHKNDPFADIRQQAPANSSTSLKTTLELIKTELDGQLRSYNNMTLNDNFEYDNNPLLFWKQQHNHLPLLAKIARSIFVIQVRCSFSINIFQI